MTSGYILWATVLALFVMHPVLADGDVKTSEIYKEDFECARKLQKYLKENNKSSVAKLIGYPIVREKPLPPIKSEDDFMRNWDDFFDASTIPAIVDKEPEVVGWRGVMLGKGDIWFGNGKIKGINIRTVSFERKFLIAREKESTTLYPSARAYKSIELECNTLDAHIRIQQYDNGLHFFSWKKGVSTVEKPTLALKGVVDIQGSAGNRLYKFKKGSYSYEIFDPSVCEGGCNIHVTTFKKGKQISSKSCK